MQRTARPRFKHKHFILDEAKIKQAQKLLGTTTETETIDKALDQILIRERPETAAAKGIRERALAVVGQFRSGHSDVSVDHDRYLAEDQTR